MQKFIDVNGIRLSYYENNTAGPSILFFIHGNSGSGKTWSKQVGDDLLSEYRLIAFDLPGHGRSSHSDHPDDDYSPIGTAKILSEAIKKLAGTQPFILIGFSYGTNLVVEMLNYGLNPKGMVLIASCVLGSGYDMDKVFISNKQAPIILYNEPDQDVVKKWFSKELISATKQELQTLAEDYFNVSPNFKPSLYKTAAEGKISDEIAVLQKYKNEVCLVFGAGDNLVNINYLDDAPFLIWRNNIMKIENAGHWVGIDRSEALNQILHEYANDVFKSSHD